MSALTEFTEITNEELLDYCEKLYLETPDLSINLNDPHTCLACRYMRNVKKIHPFRMRSFRFGLVERYNEIEQKDIIINSYCVSEEFAQFCEFIPKDGGADNEFVEREGDTSLGDLIDFLNSVV